MYFNNPIIYFLIGILCITFIDTAGAVASRKFNFNYSYLSIFSFFVYTFIAYVILGKHSISIAFLVNAILGFYDGTVGFKLSIILKANSDINLQEGKKPVSIVSGFVMVIIAVAFVFGALLLRKII